MNKRNIIFFLIIVAMSTTLLGQIEDPKLTEVWDPVPRVVTPGIDQRAPSDAIVLFDGTDASAWQHNNGENIDWKIEGGAMTVVKNTGAIYTKETFGDVQIHLEWKAPVENNGEGQGQGNSGVYLQSRYEVQVLNSYQNSTYSNGQAGSIYKQHMPLVNACRPPGEWQAYDIIYEAPRFNSDGIKVVSGFITVIHNGILIQNHVEIKGTTEYIGLPKNRAHGKAALELQDHGNQVSYRNIWIRNL